MARIDWSRISERDFNALIDALLVREYTGDGLTAQAIDGRGGDGGIDVDVRANKTAQIVHVYQVKYFPEGFSGGFVKRRQQIKKSLKRAIEQTNTPAWSLVVPRKVTAPERKCVRAMREGAQVTIRFIGPPELNGLLAKHPDIENRFTSDREVAIFREVNRESAALARPGDLHSEVKRLHHKANSRSEYWGTSFRVDRDGTTVEELYAKRSDAPEREPLRLKATFVFSERDEEMRKQFEATMKFGALDDIVLPPHVVESFVREGPEWFAGPLGSGSLTIGPDRTDHTAEPVAVEVKNIEGEPLARLEGQTTARSMGSDGVALQTDLRGGLRLTWRIPKDLSTPGRLDLKTDFTGQSGARLRRAIRFLDELANAELIGLAVSGRDFAWLKVADLDRGAFTGEHKTIASFVDDLCVLETRNDIEFSYPDGGPTVADVVNARIARMVFEGFAVADPRARSFGGPLAADPSDPFVQFVRDGGAIRIVVDRETLNVMGTPVELGPVAFYAPRAGVDDAQRVLQAIASGGVAGIRVEIRPRDGTPWVLFSPQAYEAKGTAAIEVSPWAVYGVPEHTKFAELPRVAET